MKQLLDQIADHFLRDLGNLSDSELSKARVFINTCFFSFLLLLIASFNRFLFTDNTPVFGLSLSLALVSLPFLIKLTKNYERFSFTLPLLAVLATPSLVYLRGGIGSTQATLFILIPMLSFYFTGSKRGAILSLIGLCSLFVFHYLDYNGFQYPQSVFLSKEMITQTGITLISIYVLISYVTWHYEKLNQEAQRKLVESEKKAHLANRTKDTFWANISHEIRTPLNGILGMTNLVLDSRISKDQRELLEIIKDSGENLNIILSDVIDYSKIETNELEIVKRPFDLKQCLEEVKQLFFHMANEKNIKLSYSIDSDVPKGILTDQNRLKQVLINLVANAIKFTDYGHVKIIVEKSERKDTLNFIVEDTGIGIPDKKMERLFRPFTQIDDGRTRRYGGTGIGLIICKKILDLLGGSIKVESKVGSGSIFTFSLKSIQVQLAPQRGNSHSDQQNHLSRTLNLRVLIAEDNSVNRKLLVSLLNKNHIYPDVAVNGLQAFEMAKDKEYDLIFMDIQMPVMDGINATKKIIAQWNETKNKQRPTIIAVTANVLQEDRERCFEAGMDDFMAKPINNNILVSVVDRYSHQFISKSSLSKTQMQMNTEASSILSYQIKPENIINAKKERSEKFKSFDANQLMQHFSDDFYIVENMFEQFLNKYLEDISSLQEAIDTQDFPALALRAHSLKGTFTTLFCEEGRSKSMELEAMAKENEIQSSQELLNFIRDICESLIKDYQAFIKLRKTG